MKKYLAGLLTGIIIMLSFTAFADTAIQNAVFTDAVKFKVNGQDKPITFVNVDGTNYGKVRDIVGAMGGNLNWDDSTSTILVSTNSTPTPTITPQPTVIPQGGYMYKLTSSSLTLDNDNGYHESIAENNEIYLNQAVFGKYLQWDGNDTATISLPNKPVLTYYKSNIGTDGNTKQYHGLIFIKLSALGLKTTLNGDILDIE